MSGSLAWTGHPVDVGWRVSCGSDRLDHLHQAPHRYRCTSWGRLEQPHRANDFKFLCTMLSLHNIVRGDHRSSRRQTAFDRPVVHAIDSLSTSHLKPADGLLQDHALPNPELDGNLWHQRGSL